MHVIQFLPRMMEKVFSSIDAKYGGIDGISSRLEHSLKAPDSIDVTDDGIDMYLIECHHLSIVFNVDGSDTFGSEEQSGKQCSLITV